MSPGRSGVARSRRRSEEAALTSTHAKRLLLRFTAITSAGPDLVVRPRDPPACLSLLRCPGLRICVRRLSSSGGLLELRRWSQERLPQPRAGVHPVFGCAPPVRLCRYTLAVLYEGWAATLDTPASRASSFGHRGGVPGSNAGGAPGLLFWRAFPARSGHARGEASTTQVSRPVLTLDPQSKVSSCF